VHLAGAEQGEQATLLLFLLQPLLGTDSLRRAATCQIGLVGYREVGHWQGAQRRRSTLLRQGGCKCAVARDLCSPPPKPGS
jgi:hypothetical protein